MKGPVTQVRLSVRIVWDSNGDFDREVPDLVELVPVEIGWDRAWRARRLDVSKKVNRKDRHR